MPVVSLPAIPLQQPKSTKKHPRAVKNKSWETFRPLGLHTTKINDLASLPRDGIGAMFNISGSPRLLSRSHLQGFQTACKVLQHLPCREKFKKKRNKGRQLVLTSSSPKVPCSSERLRCRASLTFKFSVSGFFSRHNNVVKKVEGGEVAGKAFQKQKIHVLL